MEPEHTPKTSVIPRATRCNREVPCSNCVTSKIPCRPAGRQPSQRASAERPAESHPSIQQLHERLRAVEDALRNQTENHANRHTPNSTPNTTPNVEDDSSTHHCLWEDQPVAFEGDSSFRQQTYLASQIEELKVEAAQSPIVVDELETLRGICQSHERTEPKQLRRLPHVGKGSQLQLPPSDLVIRLLRTVSEQSILFLFYAVENRVQVEDLCRRVYFSVDPVTIGEVTLLNGFLSVLLRDIDYEKHPEFDPQETSRVYNMCHANFKSGIETYEVMAVPTFEHTLILSIASLRAQQDAAIIQDFDIDVEPFEISNKPERRPWDTSFSAFIEFGRIQSKIYEHLYSPAASRTSDEERSASVAHLTKRLSAWYDSWRIVDYTHAYRKELFQFTFEGLDVVYYSILTLVHRGASSSNSASSITEECFDAARKGLTAHATAFPRSASGGYAALFSYAVWTHLYSSFTPYIITFLHCIRNSDLEDLNLLRSTLEISERLSGLVESCKRQYELCRSLYRIAEAYIKSKKGIAFVDGALENTIHLPLQQPAMENWPTFDSQLEPNAFPDLHVDEWNSTYMGHMSFTLDNQLGKGNA
ncbi:hypothetical protein CGCTS75_v006740 [Colletotrichum tropicale]|nr:hypothetical protein CGCTS75_v006740 [Colletotrichum tropicale]